MQTLNHKLQSCIRFFSLNKFFFLHFFLFLLLFILSWLSTLVKNILIREHEKKNCTQKLYYHQLRHLASKKKQINFTVTNESKLKTLPKQKSYRLLSEKRVTHNTIATAQTFFALTRLYWSHMQIGLITVLFVFENSISLRRLQVNTYVFAKDFVQIFFSNWVD